MKTIGSICKNATMFHSPAVGLYSYIFRIGFSGYFLGVYKLCTMLFFVPVKAVRVFFRVYDYLGKERKPSNVFAL